MKDSFYKNIRYMYNKAFDYFPIMKKWLLLYILCGILEPFTNALSITIVIDLIIKKTKFSIFFICISIIGGISILLNVGRNYYFEHLFWHQTLIRSGRFTFSLFDKQMTRDYANIEPADKQLALSQALNSTYGNIVGIELFYKSFPDVVINLLGLIIYSFFISKLNFMIIFIFICMALLNLYLSKLARDFEQNKKGIFNSFDMKIEYLYKQSNDYKNGKDIRLYKMQKWFKEIFVDLLNKRIYWNKKIQTRYFLPQLSDQLLLCIRDIVSYSILVSMVLNQEITITTFTFYLSIIGGFSTWLNQFVLSLANLKRANLGVNDFRAYEEMPNHFNHGKGINIDFLTRPLTIEFKNVSFTYPKSDNEILKNVSFEINAGEKVALVGLNGAGKTTIVKLLSGLYYPTKGEILINKHPVSDFNLNDYYKIIGTVFQDVQIFPFSIAANITGLRDEDIDKENLWNCLKLAGLDEKVNSLPKKEYTYLTQIFDKDGIQLSGGEMQKLMLARAIYKGAPIMILDEPTAALDPIAEKELYEQYNDLTKDTTSLFISHRLSSTKFCDRILLLDNGQIIENGTHDELIVKNGKYAEMFRIQSQYYKEEEDKLNENIH